MCLPVTIPINNWSHPYLRIVVTRLGWVNPFVINSTGFRVGSSQKGTFNDANKYILLKRTKKIGPSEQSESCSARWKLLTAVCYALLLHEPAEPWLSPGAAGRLTLRSTCPSGALHYVDWHRYQCFAWRHLVQTGGRLRHLWHRPPGLPGPGCHSMYTMIVVIPAPDQKLIWWFE